MSTPIISGGSTWDLNLPSRRRCWQLAFVSPAVVGPIWIIVTAGHGGLLPTFAGAVLTLLLLAAAVTDLAHNKIYNWATYTAFAWAVAINSTGALANQLGQPVPDWLGAIGLLPSLAGGGLAFVVMLIAYRMAGGGAGDVKIATAIGALVGARIGVFAIAYAYVFAFAAMLAWTVWKQGPRTVLAAVCRRLAAWFAPAWVSAPSEEQKQLLDQPVALGPYFALGTLFALL